MLRRLSHTWGGCGFKTVPISRAMYAQTMKLVRVPGPFSDIYWAGTRTHPFPSLVFLPFLPVNQTGVKRRLISPLSGWQCLGDRPVVANWMVLCPLSSCINPSHISLTWTPLSSPLLSPHPFINPSSPFFPQNTPPSPSPLPCLHLSLPAAQCYPSLTLLLFPFSAHPFLFSIERCRATRGNSLVHCSQVNWLAQRKGLKKKKWMRRTPTPSRKKRESTCMLLTLAAPLNSDAAAVRPDVIFSHWLVLQSC